MFLRVIVAACLFTGIGLSWGAGRSWLPAPRWSLLGAALTDIAFMCMVPEYVTRHSRAWVVFVSFGFVTLTIDAVRKYNKLRQATT